MAPSQSEAHHGNAHSVSTSANPASFPPTERLTNVVAADSAESCPLVTSGMVAPEQARKFRAYPRAAEIRDG